MTQGISGVVSPGKTDAIRFNAIRIYKENSVSGAAAFIVMFGEPTGTIGAALELSYDFTILSYPEKKGAAEVLGAEIREKIQYYVKESP
jgi:hypothetical protein